MKLIKIASNRPDDPGYGGGNGCASGTCPSLYRDTKGRLYVQGYRVRPSVEKAANPSQGEMLVEIDRGLLKNIQRLA
jgi:hypothetical protein